MKVLSCRHHQYLNSTHTQKISIALALILGIMPRIVSLFIWRRQKKNEIWNFRWSKVSLFIIVVVPRLTAHLNLLFGTLCACALIKIIEIEERKMFNQTQQHESEWGTTVFDFISRDIDYFMNFLTLRYDNGDIKRRAESGSYQWIIFFSYCETLYNNNNKSSINCDDERNKKKNHKSIARNLESNNYNESMTP